MTQAEHVLKCELRSDIGSPACRRLRRDGRVPANVYGGADGVTSISADSKATEALIKIPSILTLDLGDSQKKVLVHETQWNYLKGELLHVDFREVRMDQKIRTSVPLVTIGEAAGLAEGGVLDQTSFEIEVECLPGDLPEKIEIDISGLGIGDHFNVSDLAMPEGVVATATDESQMLAQVYLPRVMEEEPAEGEGEEGEEGAEGEGEAAAEGGADAAADGGADKE